MASTVGSIASTHSRPNHSRLPKIDRCARDAGAKARQAASDTASTVTSQVKELLDQQSRAERLKNFPYPRQYATINKIFIWCFAALLPFCVVREFDGLNDAVSGLLAGRMAWLAIPFSTLVSWMYVSLDQVGESTENPFEGAANDVPISQISRLVEIELGETLGETDLPPLLHGRNEIIL